MQLQLALVEGAQRNPGQALQFARVLGHAALPQQGRRGHGNARHLGHAQRNHRRVDHGADLHGAVDAFGNEVRLAVMQQPFDLDGRMAVQKRQQRRHELVLAKGVGRDHAQQAARRVLGAAQVGLQRVPCLQQLARMLQAALAVVGQRHGVGGAPQQAQAQRALQRLQAPADRGLGGGHLLRSGRKTAAFDDAHKGLQQLDAVSARRQGKVGKGHTPSVYRFCRRSHYRGVLRRTTLRPSLFNCA